MYEEIEPLLNNKPNNINQKRVQYIENKSNNEFKKNYQPENQDIQMLPKELFEISKIIPNLYLSGKYGEKFYDNFDIIINLNYPENKVPKNCLHVEKGKIYRLGLDDSHIDDIYTYFDILSALIITSLKENKKVLVHCHAGISRSVSIILAFFIKYANMSLNNGLKKIKEKRNIIQPNQSFLKQLYLYEQKCKIK